MYYDDHLPPHFHAKYGEHEITVNIETGAVNGHFPRRALRHVMEWYEIYRAELSEDWNLARQRRPLRRIAPLE
jgi:hypothetical protein